MSNAGLCAIERFLAHSASLIKFVDRHTALRFIKVDKEEKQNSPL